jgi:hypothetical protein
MKNLLWKGFLLLCKINIFCESLLDCQLKTLSHALNDILAILCSVNDPTDGFFESLGLLCLVKTFICVVSEHSLDDSQNIQKQVSSWVCACTTDTIFNSMEQDNRWVVNFDFCQLVFFQTFWNAFKKGIFFTFDVRSEVGLKGIGNGPLKFRKCLKIMLVFVLSFDRFPVFFCHQFSDLWFELQRKFQWFH